MRMRLCPIVETSKIIGTRWRLTVMRYLMDGPKKFNELKRLAYGSNSKTISRTLKLLEGKGLVQRKVLHSSPLYVEYSLTSKGDDVKKILRVMEKTGEKWKLC